MPLETCGDKLSNSVAGRFFQIGAFFTCFVRRRHGVLCNGVDGLWFPIVRSHRFYAFLSVVALNAANCHAGTEAIKQVFSKM